MCWSRRCHARPPARPPGCLPACCPPLRTWSTLGTKQNPIFWLFRLLDAIKSLILGAYQDAASLAGAPWLPQPSSSSGGVTLLGAAQAAALRSALLQCTRNSGHNQAGIAQAIAQLASSLIEAGSGGGAGFGAGKAGNAGSVAAAAAAAAAALSGHDDPGAEAGDSDATPGQRAAALGTCLLLELFDHAGRDVRREVVALCHSRLIGAKVGGRLAARS